MTISLQPRPDEAVRTALPGEGLRPNCNARTCTKRAQHGGACTALLHALPRITSPSHGPGRGPVCTSPIKPRVALFSNLKNIPDKVSTKNKSIIRSHITRKPNHKIARQQKNQSGSEVVSISEACLLPHLASLHGSFAPEPLEEAPGDLPSRPLVGVFPRRSEEMQQDHPAVEGALGLVLALSAPGAGEPLRDRGRARQETIRNVTAAVLHVALTFTCLVSGSSTALPRADVVVVVLVARVSLSAFFSISTAATGAAAVFAASRLVLPQCHRDAFPLFFEIRAAALPWQGRHCQSYAG